MNDAPENRSAEMPGPTVPKVDTRESYVIAALAEFESPLIGYAATILNDPDRAREVVHETFIRLCQRDPITAPEQLKKWLFTICRNQALDVLRRESPVIPEDEVHWKRVAGPDLLPEEKAANDEHTAQILLAVDRLPANQREVVLLKFQQGFSYQEIADVTGLSLGNIGFILHTGLKRLRETLSPSVDRPSA